MIRRKMKLLAVTGLVFVVAFGLAGQAMAANGQAEQVRKIVVFQQWIINEDAQETIIERTGAAPLKPLPLVNAWVALASPANEEALKARGEVLRVDEDAIVYALARGGIPGPPDKEEEPPPPEELPWGVDQIDAELAWATSTGAGIKVAVLDTGIDLDHPDLQANIKGGVNIINSHKTADDDNGHGTHVAGTIAAALNNEIGVIGVAPEAHLYAVKVLNRRGSGFVSDVIEGLQWGIDQEMQVMNMSLGTSSDVQSLHDAVDAAYAAGIVLVAAAGNSGDTNPDSDVIYPAKYGSVIAVAATDSNSTRASWSSDGPEVELAAPGVDIFSTWKGGEYETKSGTSMASPHVAGTAALVIGAGAVTDGDELYGIANEVRQVLQDTADYLGDANLYGYGLVDAEEAVTGTETP